MLRSLRCDQKINMYLPVLSRKFSNVMHVIKKSNRKDYWGKVCYIFLGLSFTFAIVFTIFWLVRTTDSDQSESKVTNSTQNTNDTFIATCPNFDIIGDGYCDDEANTPQCMFDLNDCCEMESDRTLCQNCTCILSNMKIKEIHQESCTSAFLGMECFHCIGNGICDLNLNEAKYHFDAGDCCLSDFDCETQYLNEHGFLSNIHQDCPEESPCILSNNFCVPEKLGDGLCQDYNNGPFCDYDLGDCCSSLPTSQFNKSECCLCNCKADDIYFYPIGGHIWM